MALRDQVAERHAGWLRIYDEVAARLPPGVEISFARSFAAHFDIALSNVETLSDAMQVVDWGWDESATVCELCGSADACHRAWTRRWVSYVRCDRCDDADAHAPHR